MRRPVLIRLPACVAIATLCANATAAPLQFGVLGHETSASVELARHDSENLAFIVVNGIKNETEPCDETLFMQRKEVLDQSQHGVIISLAASDWLSCAGNYPLPQLRTLMFDGDLSLGNNKLLLTRLANNPKFRRYVENARWEQGGILFATINLPAGNNHFRHEAGRNGEFEDRLVANRLWLQRLFALVPQKKLRGLVLFSDGNLWQPNKKVRRDGFAEVRTQITQLAGKMHGKVLLIDHQPEHPANDIGWRGNVGHISLGVGWHTFRVKPKDAQPFALVTAQH